MLNDNNIANDLAICMEVLEEFVILFENDCIDNNLGDEEWNKIEPYKATLANLTYLSAIYG